MNLIDKALKHIKTHGWCQGSLRSTNGSLCIRGALIGYHVPEYEAFTSFMPEIKRAEKIIRDIVREQFPDHSYTVDSIPWINDNILSSQEEVEMVLQKASAKYDEVV